MNEIKILNPTQVYFYIENGVKPLRVECGFKKKLVFVFEREETKHAYGLWMGSAINKWKEFNANKIIDEK